MDIDSSRDRGRGVRGRRHRAEPKLPLFHRPIQPLDRGDACRVRGVANRQDVQAVREGYPRGDVAAQIRVHRVHYADGRCVLRGARADGAGSVRQRRKRAHSRRRARVRDRRPLCRQTRRARLRHRCLGARAADLLYRVRDDRLRPQLGLRQRAELPLLLPQLDVARRRVRLRRRRGILHGDVLVDTRVDRAGLWHRARLCGDPQTRERRRRRQNRDRNRGRRGRRGERRRDAGRECERRRLKCRQRSAMMCNAKVDEARFYSKHSFYSLADLQDQLKRYNREYNHTPIRPLGWKSPNQYLADYFNNKSVTDV